MQRDKVLHNDSADTQGNTYMSAGSFGFLHVFFYVYSTNTRVKIEGFEWRKPIHFDKGSEKTGLVGFMINTSMVHKNTIFPFSCMCSSCVEHFHVVIYGHRIIEP